MICILKQISGFENLDYFREARLRIFLIRINFLEQIVNHIVHHTVKNRQYCNNIVTVLWYDCQRSVILSTLPIRVTCMMNFYHITKEQNDYHITIYWQLCCNILSFSQYDEQANTYIIWHIRHVFWYLGHKATFLSIGTK